MLPVPSLSPFIPSETPLPQIQCSSSALEVSSWTHPKMCLDNTPGVSCLIKLASELTISFSFPTFCWGSEEVAEAEFWGPGADCLTPLYKCKADLHSISNQPAYPSPPLSVPGVVVCCSVGS